MSPWCRIDKRLGLGAFVWENLVIFVNIPILQGTKDSRSLRCGSMEKTKKELDPKPYVTRVTFSFLHPSASMAEYLEWTGMNSIWCEQLRAFHWMYVVFKYAICDFVLASEGVGEKRLPPCFIFSEIFLLVLPSGVVSKERTKENVSPSCSAFPKVCFA